MINPNNIAILHGYLGREPELKEYKNAKGEIGKLCKLSVGVSRTGEGTDWFDVTYFGRTGEVIEKFFGKGSQILIIGEYQSSTRDADDGKKRKFWSVRGEAFAFCDSKDSARGQNNEAVKEAEAEDIPDSFEAAEGDIPF